MYRPKDMQERITHRLKISRGHLNKVIEMVEKDEYCIDVIHQSQAIQKALREIDNLILSNHLNSCVTDAFDKGSNKEAMAEVMTIFKKMSL
jgi:CsoR family transcriptional regulator, copper-sensing transcriptional repressor